MKLKICGAVNLDEIALLNYCKVDYIGLWTGIVNHPRSLAENQLKQLSYACNGPTPVAVCIRPTYPELGNMLQRCGIQWLQLHGFTPPIAIARLKQQGVRIIKTLHVGDSGDCPELRWLSAYDDAGVDIYLIDRFVDRQQLGSTGQMLSRNVINSLIDQLARRRIWLAGGITTGTIGKFSAIPGVETLDIDSAARRDGFISDPVCSLMMALNGDGGVHG